MSRPFDLGGKAGLALVAGGVAAAVFLPVPDELGGTFLLALMISPAARWAVADPAPMTLVTTLAVGAGGAMIWGAVPTEPGETHPFLIPALWTLPPILAAGALVAVYRIHTWQPPIEGIEPLRNRWLARGSLVALALFPFAFLVIAVFIAEAGINLDDRGLLEYLVEPAAGVSATALVLVATRWGSSRFWLGRAEERRKELSCAPDCS